MPGKKYASIKKPKMYEDLRQKGYTKSSAAAISNASAAGTLAHKKRRHRQRKRKSSY